MDAKDRTSRGEDLGFWACRTARRSPLKYVRPAKATDAKVTVPNNMAVAIVDRGATSPAPLGPKSATTDALPPRPSDMAAVGVSTVSMLRGEARENNKCRVEAAQAETRGLSK